jgi:limonene-1,2-epoxide hydrolase
VTAPEPAQWVAALFASVDAKDLERWSAFLADEVCFRYGSNPEIRGKAAVGDAARAIFASFSALEHRIEEIVAAGASVMCRGCVTYTLADARRVSLPFANVFHLDAQGLIGDYLIYIDPTPLLALAAACGG